VPTPLLLTLGRLTIQSTVTSARVKCSSKQRPFVLQVVVTDTMITSKFTVANQSSLYNICTKELTTLCITVLYIPLSLATSFAAFLENQVE